MSRDSARSPAYPTMAVCLSAPGPWGKPTPSHALLNSWCMSQCHPMALAAQGHVAVDSHIVTRSCPPSEGRVRRQGESHEWENRSSKGPAASLLIYSYGWALDVPCGASPTSPHTL